MIKSLYLAHPLVMRKEIREWELGFEERTGIQLDNPFYDKGPNDPEAEEIKLIDTGRIIPNTMNNPKKCLAIVEYDLRAIEQTDVIVAFIEKGKESMGTPMEVFYSSRVLQHPTYIITKTMPGHPWIRGLATKLFEDTEQFEEYLKNGRWGR